MAGWGTSARYPVKKEKRRKQNVLRVDEPIYPTLCVIMQLVEVEMF